MTLSRRQVLALCLVLPATPALARLPEPWTVRRTFEALQSDTLRLLDVRSRPEWAETGVARGAWPVSLHEKGFPQRLFRARDLADGRTVALICATGGRTASVMRALDSEGHQGFVDVSEGMLGSAAGPGWIASGLPVLTLDQALAALPRALA